MIDKKLLTKKILYQGDWWDLVKIISPNDFDDYLLLSMEKDNDLHSDEKTPRTEMVLIDAHDEIFATDTKEMQEAFEEFETLFTRMAELEEKVYDNWAVLLPEEENEEEEESEER